MSDHHGYVILIEPTPDGGYGAWAPDLPGCVALGDSPDEVTREMRDAIAFHLDGMRVDGQPVPAPSTTSVVVDGMAA